ncbi:hypothetical protein Syun_013862 [Stephania yunnanensis]|uniref:Uncharacterized protein n=1 Tax=Stephania yunnanensis TaxID=152371 RepID=A0AAP0JIE3_9MAGN
MAKAKETTSSMGQLPQLPCHAMPESGNFVLYNSTSRISSCSTVRTPANIIKNITNDHWDFPINERTQFYRATLDRCRWDLQGVLSYIISKWQLLNKMVFIKQVNNRCDPKGLCGLNAYYVHIDAEPECRYIPQFDFINQADKTSDCVRIRKISYDCRNNTKKEEEMTSTMTPVRDQVIHRTADDGATQCGVSDHG